jgi:hypothetical protein
MQSLAGSYLSQSLCANIPIENGGMLAHLPQTRSKLENQGNRENNRKWRGRCAMTNSHPNRMG